MEVFMKAKDLMTPGVECISPEAELQDVAIKMKTMDVGFLPVCESDRLAGTITDRDIVLRVIAEGRDPKTMKAREVMTPAVFWCYEDQSVDEVADFMAHKEIRRILVVDGTKRLTGVISIGDLAKRGNAEKAGGAIADIAEAPPARAA
jgi:CBS domain-containing protein